MNTLANTLLLMSFSFGAGLFATAIKVSGHTTGGQESAHGIFGLIFMFIPAVVKVGETLLSL